MAFIALIDANVLVNAPVRDTVFRAAEYDLYRMVLSYQILEEMRRALETNLGRTREQTDRLIGEILRSFEDAIVEGYEDMVDVMRNDPGDRHVLAAAVRAGAECIVTENIRHFQPSACEPYGIEAQRSDEFLLNLWGIDPELMARILVEQACDLTGWTVADLVKRLRQSVPHFITAVERSGLLNGLG